MVQDIYFFLLILKSVTFKEPEENTMNNLIGSQQRDLKCYEVAFFLLLLNEIISDQWKGHTHCYWFIVIFSLL